MAGNLGANAIGIGPDGSFAIQVPEGTFPGNNWVPNGINQPAWSGDPSRGVPQINAPGSTTSNSPGGTTTSDLTYGNQAAASSPTQQPAFWFVVLMIVALVLFGHLAHKRSRA